MIKELLSRWPVVKQIRTGSDGTGPEAWSERTRHLLPKTHDCEKTRSICPYCGVGCGQLIYHKDGKTGFHRRRSRFADFARTPLPQRSCDTFQLHTHPGRLKKVKYRRPYATEWEELDLETAMDMVADRVWKTREQSFVEKNDKGETVMHTVAMAHLGGATLDNEENYLIKKLFTGGLGMVASATRPAYDIAQLCPVWAHRSAAAAPPPRSRSCTTPTPF